MLGKTWRISMEIQRESIIASAFRSFFKALFGIFGVIVAILIAAVMVFFFTPPYAPVQRPTALIAEDANGSTDLLPQSAPVILRLRISGTIGGEKCNAEQIRAVLGAARDPFLLKRLRAIFLELDTPGGAATDSDTIRMLIKEFKTAYKIPVFAFTDNLCASGGMMISCAADKFYASPSSIVGSIGVRMGPAFNVWKFIQDHGIDAKTLSIGANKTLLDPFEPWGPSMDLSPLESMMHENYDRFVNLVAEARPALTAEKIKTELGANIFTSSKAVELGLIDVADATYYSAMKALATTAGIAEDVAYQVIELRVEDGALRQLMGSSAKLFSKLAHHPLIANEQAPSLEYSLS